MVTLALGLPRMGRPRTLIPEPGALVRSNFSSRASVLLSFEIRKIVVFFWEPLLKVTGNVSKPLISLFVRSPNDTV